MNYQADLVPIADCTCGMMPKRKSPLRNSRKDGKAVLECGEVHISFALTS